MFTHHFAHAQQHAAVVAPKTKPADGIILPFIAMGLGVIILSQDFSSINVALPAIERDFNTALSTVQWVINAFALVFAMLIVAGGRFADLFGRKRIFLIGATIFAVMSFVGGFAPNVLVLIGARATMGIGGAFMWPAILGMTYAIVPKEKAGLAGGLILGAAGVGQSIGPLLGGALTELISWRWTFFVNVPIALFAMLVAYFKIHPAMQPPVDPKIDWAGIATLSLGLLSLLFGLDQAVAWGWTDPRLLGLLTFSALLFALFVFVERRAGTHALVPGDLMGNRAFLAACLGTGLLAPIFLASLLYIPQYLQKLLNASPFNSGLGMLPMMILFAVISFIGGTLYDKLGARAMVSGGALCCALGAVVLGFLTPTSGYGVVLIGGLIFLGVGLGLFYSSVTTAAVSAVNPERTSLAGGLIYMFQIAGGAVGLGLATTVVTLTADAYLNTALAKLGASVSAAERLAMQGVLAGTETAQQILKQFAPAVAQQINVVAENAFVAGLQNSFWINAALAFAGFLIVLFFLRLPKKAS